MTNKRYRYQTASVGGMMRGFSGMLTYYGVVGILLGVFALCVGGPLVVFRLLGDDEVQGQPGTAGDHQPREDTPTWLRPYVGNFSRHGQSLDIAPDGKGLETSRVYGDCADTPADPCQIRFEFTVVQDGGAVVGRGGNGRDIPLTVVKPGILNFGDSTYCDGDVIEPGDPAVEPCGA